MSSKRTGFSLPTGMLGALVLIALVDRSLERWVDLPADKLELSWCFATEAAENAVSKAKVVCLGDSLVKLGLQPRILESKLQRPAYNLAVPGGQTPTMAMVFERALSHGLAPELVIFHADPNLMAVSPLMNSSRWGRVGEFGQVLELGWEAGDPDAIRDLILANALASVRNRSGLRMAARQALHPSDRPPHPRSSYYWRNWVANQGAQLSADETWTGPIPGANLAAPRRGWHPHPLNVIYLQRFLTRVRDVGAQPIWVLPPFTQAWNAHRQTLGAQEDFDLWLNRFLRQFPEVVVIDGRNAAYPDSMFRDATHLNRDGAIRLSLEVSTAIQKLQSVHPSAVARMDLPFCAESPESFRMLEDLQATRIRLGQRDEDGGRVR